MSKPVFGRGGRRKRRRHRVVPPKGASALWRALWPISRNTEKLLCWMIVRSILRGPIARTPT